MRRPSAEGALLPWSRGAIAALLLFLLSPAALVGATGALAAGDEVLPGSGIRYPGGFDQNTVGEVRGVARELTKPDRGPVTFRLDGEGGRYTVLTSPSWYWDDLRAALPDGAEVVVRGSKSLGRDEGLYIVAQEVRLVAAGASLVFRSPQGHPLWGGGRMGGRSGAQTGGQGGAGGAGGAGSPGGYGGPRHGGRR